MPGMVHNIRIVFGAQTQPSITIQQSDYNSRKIQAACFTSSGTPMDFSDTTVTVVYNAGAAPTKEYPVTVEGNILSFTIPGLAAQTAGSWSMQIFIYWAGSLLHSAEIPYTVLKTITPGTGGDDPVPALVLLIQQAQDAIGECNKATENANKTVANIEKKLADGDFIGKTGDTGPQGFQGVGVTGASLNGQGELVFTVKDPATGESSTLLPVDIDTSAAINTVEQAAQDGVQKVQDAQASAISAVDQAAKKAGTQAVIEVYSAKDTAIADIATVKSGAESAITAAQQSAVQTVQQSGTTAVGQVQKAQNTATTAIAQAQQNAITSVENEGDAQVQRLQEIVPQPTADNNGMVVAVQSGAYQLVNPAGLVLNDGVITSENGWSSMQIVNTLCPPFAVSGATVQCTPVANYPLGLQVEITPTQEGTGDPSPENVRPIVGWDAVTIHQSNGDQDNTYTVQLGQTIYGGTVDAVTGVGEKEWRCVEISGAESISLGNVDASDTIQQFNIDSDSFLAQPDHTCFCNVLPDNRNTIAGSIIGVWVYSDILIILGFPRSELMDYGFVAGNTETYVKAFKAYLAAQYAAGTPVTIAYKLATPTAFQATGGQTIPALPGTNTIFADSGDITVTGASDPIATITALQDRVSALESAQTNM